MGTVFYKGTDDPIIVFDPLGAATVITLYNSKVLVDRPDKDMIVHPSIATGTVTYIMKGKYWRFNLQLNLWKYDDAGHPSPYSAIQMWQVMNTAEDTLVKLKRSSGDDYFKDGSDADVYFMVESVTQSLIFRGNDYDEILFINMKSNRYIDLENTRV